MFRLSLILFLPLALLPTYEYIMFSQSMHPSLHLYFSLYLALVLYILHLSSLSCIFSISCIFLYRAFFCISCTFLCILYFTVYLAFVPVFYLFILPFSLYVAFNFVSYPTSLSLSVGYSLFLYILTLSLYSTTFFVIVSCIVQCIQPFFLFSSAFLYPACFFISYMCCL